MDWISVKERLPEQDEGTVLVLANGKPCANITLVWAYQLATYMWPDILRSANEGVRKENGKMSSQRQWHRLRKSLKKALKASNEIASVITK